MSQSSEGPVRFFTDDHRRCDEVWAQVEAAVEASDEAAASERWTAFDAAMRRHFAMEEEVLFPALEEASGMRGGPTEVMRVEHAQMRGVLDQMASAAASGDYEEVADHGDTLLMLIQQHNVKEEGILYPMAAQFLSAQWADVAARIDRY